MESFHKEANTYRGIEVLYFENAELTKFKGDKNSYASFGPLSVLYFKDFKRFVLQLNDWRYPLFRRIPISKEGSQSSPSYILPGLLETSYRLTISDLPNNEGIANFESILNHNSNFSSNGEENTLRRLEASPDDKLVRQTGIAHKESGGIKSALSGAIKTATDKVKATAGSFKGSKTTLPKKKRSNLSEIKIRDFKNEAKSTFKKNYFEASNKLSNEFLKRRKDNINLSQVREFNDLRKTAENAAATFFIRRDELEDSILNIKDIITQRSYTMEPLEKKGLMQNLKQGITSIFGGKQTESTEASQDSGMTQGSDRRNEGSISQNRPSREIISVHDKVEKVPAPEGMSHYQA